MEAIHIDLETRSQTDLITAGVYNYVQDPSTGVICCCWAFGNGPVNTWIPDQEPFPDDLADYIARGVPLYAHNAQFERLMFDFVICPDFDLPAIPLEQWYCTSFQARCNNIPTSLFNAARALRVPAQKGTRGRELIRIMSLPQPDGTFFSTPDLLSEMVEYCADDVRAERNINQVMRAPTDEEWLDYWVGEYINDRGVKIDRELCLAATQYAKDEEEEILCRIEEVTGGEVTKARGEGLKAWVIERLTDEQKQLLIRYRDGEKKQSLDRQNRARLLDLDDLDPDVREVVECSDAVAKSSVSKFVTMVRRADFDDRVCGAFMANGASQSGRYSAKGLQVHNYPRGVMENPLEVRADLVDNVHPVDIQDYFKLPLMELLSRMLRAALIPEDGKVFVGADWSSIEGRTAPWLTNSPSGEAKLDLYRNDKDVYVVSAQAIYGDVEIDSAKRQVGKVCLAYNTMVLTDSGLVPIQDVTAEMKVWDGVEWVEQQGAVYNGEKPCVKLSEMRLTPDHLIWCGTTVGWIPAEKVVSNESIHSQALASGSECLPSQGWAADTALKKSLFNVIADGLSKSLPVYDLLNAGPRRRFTVVTADGPLIVHNCELSLCYGGGAGAFLAMARGYGVSVTSTQADEIKLAWRKSNPWAPALWEACETAAKWALQTPGEVYEAGRLRYFALEGVLDGNTALFCELPCGRLLTYPDAKLEPYTTPWGAKDTQITAMRSAWTPKQGEAEWPRGVLWGGLLVENATQGTAASLLRAALRGLDDVVLHVHDEIVLEVPEHLADQAAEHLQRVMETPPAWAKGLPLAAEAQIMERFGK